MNTVELQALLKATGRYSGGLDGDWGKLTDAAVMLALEDGPDTALTDSDFKAAGERIDVAPAAIRAFWKVEANGAGFQNGMPKILPEPHRFSKATARAFDQTNPTLSYPKWGSLPYPKTQRERYQIILDWGRILSARDMPIDAAFGSASHGAPQIMGENFKACGYANAPTFAIAMARDEPTQLEAFLRFVDAAGILRHLRVVDRSPASWEPVAMRYNGTAYRVNKYHEKMAAAFKAFGG